MGASAKVLDNSPNLAEQSNPLFPVERRIVEMGLAQMHRVDFAAVQKEHSSEGLNRKSETPNKDLDTERISLNLTGVEITYPLRRDLKIRSSDNVEIPLNLLDIRGDKATLRAPYAFEGNVTIDDGHNLCNFTGFPGLVEEGKELKVI